MKDISFGKFIIIACLILLTVGYVEKGCQAANLSDWFRKEANFNCIKYGNKCIKIRDEQEAEGIKADIREGNQK